MKEFYKILSAVVLVLFPTSEFLAQTYSTNVNSTFTTCSGTFYDSGGGSADYASNETYTVTFCPSTAGMKVKLVFSAFHIDNNYDFLTVYDGPNTSAPTMGAYTGTSGPGTVMASPTNTSGCITFLFDSDWVTNRSGWAAAISCAAPCQTITANTPATTPAPDPDGIVRICPGESVSFSGSGTFSGSSAGATYSWNFHDGPNATGQNVNHTFATAGSYQVHLTITDAAGCTSNNLAQREIQVATTPVITLTAAPDPICLGQTANLTAAVTMTPLTPNCTPPVSGTTFLPDGTGVSYTTSINVVCFAPGTTITAASQIQNICLNIEHSYIGDLSIVIKCPNGQQTALLNYSSSDNTGCEYLGVPIDVDADLTAGTGATYCFSASASQTMNTAAGSVPCYGQLPPGNYLPVGNFSSLVGCPANGNWTILVTDNLASDNGYIFNWDINLNLTPSSGGGSFTPTIASQGWVAAPTLTSTGPTTATVTPTSTGSKCFNYTVTDNFGCTYTQNKCFTVNTNTPVNAGADVTICSGQSTVLTATGASTYSWSNGLGTGNPKTVTPTVTTTYTVTGTSTGGCVTTDQVTVTVVPPSAVNAGADVSVCAGSPTTLTATGATTYTWSPSTGLSGTSGASVTATPTATTTYTVTGTSGTCTSTDQIIVTVNPIPSVNAGTDQTICSGSPAALTATGGTSYTWSPSTGLSGTSGSTVTSTATSTITYTVTGTNAGSCTNTDQVQVIVNPPATANANSDQSTCAGGTVTLAGSVGGSATSGTWTAASGSFSNSTSLTSTYTPSITSGTITLTLTTNDPAGPCPSATDQVVITVTAGTPVSAGPDASICTSGSTVLTASGATTYSWSPSTGLSATNTASVTASPTVTTTYTVTGTSASGCVSTDQVTVTVGSTATVNAGPDQSICLGASVTLSATGASTYTWNNGVTNGVAFSPTATTTYTVTGTTASGCTATDQVTVTVNPLPVVVVNDATVCNAGTVTLSATGAASYSWSPSTFLSASTGASVIFTAGSTTTYTVTGTSAAGCTASDVATVTVMSTAAINAGPDVTICAGESTTLTATGGVTYTWDNGLGSGNNKVVSPTVTTTYTVTGTDASGCVGTDAVTVTIGSGITVDAGPDQSICAGASVTLTATGAVTYSWDNGVINGVAFTPLATTTYTVTGTSASGCTDTDQVTITVNPNTPVNAGPDQTVCAGTSVTLTATNGATFSWTGGVVNGVPFVPTATTTYTVSGTTAAGCITTDNVTVTVNPLPIVNAGPDQSICAGAMVTLTATGAATYSWDNGVTNGVAFSPVATATYTVNGTSAAGCVGTDQVTVSVNSSLVVDAGPDQTICNGASVTLSGSGASTYTWDNGVIDGVPFTPSVTTTYTVTGTGGAGCTGTDQVTVTVSPNVPVDAGPDQTVCAGTSVTLSGSNAATYSWSGGISDGVAFLPSATTTYTLTGTSAGGCISTDEVTVTVNPLPVVDAGADQSICSGGSVTLTATGASTYSWDNGVVNGVPFSPTTTATYTVTGTSASGCTASDQVIVSVGTSITVDAGPDQIICVGSSVTLSGAGATTYTWDNGVIDGVPFTPTVTTTYTVTGTSGAGCTGTDQVIITVSPSTPVNAGPDQTVCAGTSVTLQGSDAFTYSWSGGISDGVSFIPTATTTYILTGTSAGGCTSTDEVTVTVNPIPIVNAGADQSICSGGTVTLTATGASTYSWDNGVVNGVPFSPTATTTYTVTGTSAEGCTSSDQVIVTVGTSITVDAGPDQIVCVGSSITLSGSGATTYTWDNGVIDGVPFTPTVTTTYTVTGTSGAGCTGTDQVVITVSPSTPVDAGPDQTVCAGTSVTLTGSNAFTYTWSGGISNGVPFIPTATTTYTVTGTSAGGCVSTDDVTVTVGSDASIDAGPDQTVCEGSPVILSGSGGSTYSWDNGVVDGVPFTPGVGSVTYTVTGTTASGCTGTDQVIVTVNPNPSPLINGPTQYCTGNFAVLSTSEPYDSYLWSTGATTATINATIADNPISVTVTNSFNCSAISPVFTITESTSIVANFNITICQGESAVIHGITQTVAGTYSQTFTLGGGCDSTSNVTLTVNPLPIVDAGADQSLCIGESTSLTASGAATYSWDNGITQGIPFIPVAGSTTYTVTGTSDLGCTATDQVVVLVNPLPTVNAGADQNICEGNSVILSGSGALTYTWNNDVIDGVPFTPLATGTYTVTGTDINGCINTDEVTVSVGLSATIYAGPDQTICQGESVTLSGSGGSTFTWDNGVVNAVPFTPSATTTYTVIGTTASGCTGTDQVTVTVNPLPVVNAGADQTVCAGTSVTLTATGAATYTWSGPVMNGIAFVPSATTSYQVSGTSAEGCVSIDEVIVNVNPLPNVNAGADQTISAGSSVTLSGSGASTYTWNNGVTDGVPFTPTTTATYTVTGTDVNGCINTDQVVITVSSCSVYAGPDQTICAGSSVTLTATGAATYTWNNGVINGLAFTPTATTAYTVTGTTSDGCTATDQLTVTVNPVPVVNAGPDQSVCAGASVTLTATGAATYTWTGSVMNGIAFVPSATTTYTVTGTSASGCTASDQVIVTVNPLPAINAGADQAICIGSTVTLSGSGGSTYVWNNGVTNGVAFTPTATNTYTVTGTDANGCVNTDQVIVTVSPIPAISAGPDQSVCAGQTVTLSGSGGTTYTWSNGVTNGLAFTPTATTTYTVIGTNATGCTNTDQVTVTVNPLPIVNAGPDQSICIGASVILAGSGASSYTWNNSVINNIAFSPTATATYTVTGTNANGCVNTDQVVVTVNPLPIVNAGSDQAVCAGASVTLSGSGASTYTWNNGVTNGVPFVPVLTNTYTVSGTSAAGCINTDQVTVTVNPIPAVSAGADQTVCAGQSVTLSGSGATNYSWNNGVVNGVSFIPVSTNTYTVSGTTNGCSASDQVVVTVIPLPIVNAGPDQAVCAGTPVTLTATGASTYSWNTGITNGVAFTPAVGVTTHTVTGTSANGCTNTDQVVVTVNNVPIVSAGNDQVACGGSSVTLSGSGANTYTWDNGVINGVPFIPSSTKTYTVTGTTIAGCTDTDQVLVEVAPNPIVNAGTDMNVCEGDAVTLIASGAESYTWSNGISNGQTFVPPSGTTTYTVTGTSGDGCTATDQIVVNVKPIPTVSFSPDISKGCTPLTVTFTSVTSPSASCIWTLSDGTVVASCTHLVNTFEEEGCFDVTLTVTGTNGCINSLTVPSIVCAENPPVAQFNVSSNSITTVASEVEFYNESIGASSYEWHFGDGNSSFEVNPTNTYPEEGEATYIVTLIATSDLGCTDTALAEITVSEELVFYVPNSFTPNGDRLNDVFEPQLTAGFDPLDYTLLIFNRWGEIVFESHNAEVGWDGSYGSQNEIAVAQDGIYTWKIIIKLTENGERKEIVGHVNLIR